MKFRIPGASRIVDFVTRGKRKSRETISAKSRFRLRCNLCGTMFRAASRFLRFCKSCRTEDEAYRFSEWIGG